MWFRLCELMERRENILQELEEYTHDNYRPRRRGTGYHLSPVEIMAEGRAELEDELAEVEAEIRELESG